LAVAPAEHSAERLKAFDDTLAALEGQSGGGFGGRGGAPDAPDSLSNIGASLSALMNLLQGADVTPTTQLVAAVGERRAALIKLLVRWSEMKHEARAMNLTID